MIVHLIAATQTVSTNISTLRKIMKAIHEEGHLLARDWVEAYYFHLKNGTSVTEDPERTLREATAALQRADAVIIEKSLPSIAVGYQLAAALQMRKPILLLVKDGVKQDAFLEGLKNPLLLRRQYNNKNLNQVLFEFMRNNLTDNKDYRFNFVIDQQIYDHLRWKSYKTGKTRAEVVRDLVLRKMRETD